MIFYNYCQDKNNFNIVWMSQVDFIVISESRLKGIFSRQKLSCPCRIWQFFLNTIIILFCELSILLLDYVLQMRPAASQDYTWEFTVIFGCTLLGSNRTLLCPCLGMAWIAYIHICSYPNYSNNLLNIYSYSLFLFGNASICIEPTSFELKL